MTSTHPSRPGTDRTPVTPDARPLDPQARSADAPSPRQTARGLLGAALAGAFALAGCNSTDSPYAQETAAGTYLAKPDGSTFFVDENFGGQANNIQIVQQFYGRLVSVAYRAPLDPSAPASTPPNPTIVVHDEFVVDPRAESSWPADDYTLETNAVTGAQTLVIEADFSDTTGSSFGLSSADPTGRARFLRLLRGADAGRQIGDNGFVGSGIYTMVPRNAAVVLVFSDLLDPETLSDQAIRFLEGTPAIQPISPTPRYFADPNHGGLADFDADPGPEFYSTRIIVDAAVSELESAGSDPFVPANNRGFPASVDVNLANLNIRIPTRQLVGQSLPPLQNLTGARLSDAGAGTLDFGSASRDVVVAFRTGGNESVTGDPFNGYLPDETRPVVVSSQSAVITMAPVLTPADGPLTYRLPEVVFSSPLCATAPKAGDVIAQVPYFLRVLEDTGVDPNGVATNVSVELIEFPSTFAGPEQYEQTGLGPIQYRAPFTSESADRPECFLTIIPTPLGGVNAPDEGVATDASFALRFNEAIDPEPVEPYDSITLSRRDTPVLPTDYVPGTVEVNASLTLFRFRPTQPLGHVFGNTESYFFNLAGGNSAPRDLAGNEVSLLPVNPGGGGIELRISDQEPTTLTGGHVFRFSSRDEQFPFANPVANDRIDQIPQEEWSGTATLDVIRERLRGRSVVRFQQTVAQSTDKPLPNAMTIGEGTSLPLNPSGALTQWVWRYNDLGLNLYDQDFIRNGVEPGSLDIDVEGLYLTPFNSNPVFETYPEFEIAMAHTTVIPDEVVNPQNIPTDPNSGLGTDLSGNLVSQSEQPFQVVHPRSLGYTTQPGNTFQAPDGTLLVSLGLNDNVGISQQPETFTWRDTSIRTRGGTNASGTPLARTAQVTQIAPFLPFVDPMGMVDCTLPGAGNPLYPPGQVRTAGLPLMIQVKCYPTTGESTQNIFSHLLANPNTLRPAFRAYTSGGRDQAGLLIEVDPDAVNTATGGFDPLSTPTGASTDPLDDTVYFGGVDFVTRVSRAHSVWVPAYDPTGGLDTTFADIEGDTRFNVPEYLPATIYPASQPAGTDLRLEYRGAIAIASAGAGANELIESTNAFFTDPYGDYYESLPFELDLTQVDPMTVTYPPELGQIGNASCFDGSFSYPAANQNPNVAFFGGIDRWTSDLSTLTGATWIQTRITFIANIATNRVPEVSAIALNWRED